MHVIVLLKPANIGCWCFPAQPSLEEHHSKQHSVHLPSTDSEVPTELQCDIQPGALAQRYSVQWRRLCHNENCSDALLNVELFNITLNVTSDLDGSEYQCEVTINHDGSLSRTYNGTVIIRLIEGKEHVVYTRRCMCFGICKLNL